MKIWMINQYSMPPEYGHFNRHYNLAKYLKRLGHEPTVFVGSFLHNTDIQMIEDNSIIKRYEEVDFPYYFVKTLDYSSSKLKRIYAMYQFYKNVLKVAASFEKPDVIIGSSAHPLAAIAANKLGEKYGVMSIVEIRDLWPESFVAYGILKKWNPLLRLLYAGEKWIYQKADKIVCTMEGGRDYIAEKGWDKQNGGSIDLNKVHHLNNGVDLEVFNHNRVNYTLADADLNNEKLFKVIYTGSLRTVNNVMQIVKTAEAMLNMGIGDVKFIIYGEGDEKTKLQKYCLDNKVSNIIFKGHIDKKYIPSVLSKSDLNIFHFKQSTLKKYGAGLNKMFDYFASGKPTLSDCEFNYDLIKKYHAGIVCDSASPEELALAIKKVKEVGDDEYKAYCKNALLAAQEYDFKKLSQKLIKIIEERNYQANDIS